MTGARRADEPCDQNYGRMCLVEMWRVWMLEILI